MHPNIHALPKELSGPQPLCRVGGIVSGPLARSVLFTTCNFMSAVDFRGGRRCSHRDVAMVLESSEKVERRETLVDGSQALPAPGTHAGLRSIRLSGWRQLIGGDLRDSLSSLNANKDWDTKRSLRRSSSVIEVDLQRGPTPVRIAVILFLESLRHPINWSRKTRLPAPFWDGEVVLLA